MKQNIVVIAHNIRSAHNVGALFRTCDGFGAEHIYCTGYTPIPPQKNALRLTKAHKEIVKTALGAHLSVSWSNNSTVGSVMDRLHQEGYAIVALEQHERSISFSNVRFRKMAKVAVIAGNEVRGIDSRILEKCDAIAEIPMSGNKESLNVMVALGAFLAMLRYGG